MTRKTRVDRNDEDVEKPYTIATQTYNEADRIGKQKGNNQEDDDERRKRRREIRRF